MNKAEEYLKGLNEYDYVFEDYDDTEYTEKQLIDFAQRFSDEQNKELQFLCNDYETTIKDLVLLNESNAEEQNKELREIIKNNTIYIKDENLNEWKVIEVSEFDEFLNQQDNE